MLAGAHFAQCTDGGRIDVREPRRFRSRALLPRRRASRDFVALEPGLQ